MRYLWRPTHDISANWGFSQTARDKQKSTGGQSILQKWINASANSSHTNSLGTISLKNVLNFLYFFSFNILTSLGRNSGLRSAPLNCEECHSLFQRTTARRLSLEFNHLLVGCHYDIISKSSNKSTYSIKHLIQQNWSMKTQTMLPLLPNVALKPIFKL